MNTKDLNFQPIKFISAIVLCQGAGILGSIATVSSVNSWYLTLNKPFFTPPGWVFGPAWILLYFLMGIALYLVWIRGNISKWFWIQLFLNLSWSFAFFGYRSPGAGLIVILVLWVAILFTIKDLYRVHKPAGLILIPYILWVTFASALNLTIWYMN
jgi:translocator protein